MISWIPTPPMIALMTNPLMTRRPPSNFPRQPPYVPQQKHWSSESCFAAYHLHPYPRFSTLQARRPNSWTRAPHHQTISVWPRHSRRKATRPTRHFLFLVGALSIYQPRFPFFFLHNWYYILVHSGALFSSSSTVSLALPAGDPGSVTDSFFCSLFVHISFMFQQASIPARLFWLPVSSTVSWQRGNCLTNQCWFGKASRGEEMGGLFSRLLPVYTVSV